MLIKKLHIRFVLKVPLSNHAIHQFVRKSDLNVRYNYIQAILRDSEQLAAKTSCLGFDNKGLIETLKAE